MLISKNAIKDIGIITIAKTVAIGYQLINSHTRREVVDCYTKAAVER